MNLTVTIILIISLALTILPVQADNFEQASIKATATVIPRLGVIPSHNNYQTLTITKNTESNLLIQAPKNSELLIKLTHPNNDFNENIILRSNHSILRNYKNSVIDIIPVDLDKIPANKESFQVITIIRIDN